MHPTLLPRPAAARPLAPRPPTARPPARPAQPPRGPPRGVTCMAHPRRVARVAKQLERELGMLMLTDPTLRAAVARTPAHAADSLTALASVAAVDLTPNLAYARVYVSIYARDPAHRDAALARLTKLAPYVRRRVAAAMRLRLVPEIRFLKDDTQEAGAAVEDALARQAAVAAGLAEPPPITPSGRGIIRGPPRPGYAWPGDEEEAPSLSRSAFPDVSAEARAEAEAAAAAAAAAYYEDDEEEEDGFYDWAGEPATRMTTTPPSSTTDDDDFFGFAAPPDDGFWRDASGAGPNDAGFGDGVLGADGYVRLAPGAGPGVPSRSGGGGGGRRKKR